MSGDVQLELWMNEYKLDALAAVLARENTTVEQRMQDALRCRPKYGRRSVPASKRSWQRRRRKWRRLGNTQCSMCGRIAERSISR